MRVKVTSTCNMDEASSVVVNLLSQTQEKLNVLSNKKFNHWQVSELLAQIESMRESLANIDHSLDDASNIAAGWLRAFMDEAQTSEEEMPVAPQEEEVLDGTDY